MLNLVRTDAEDEDFRGLVGRLDAELKLRDGEDHYFFAQFNKLAGLLGVVVAYNDDEPVGCGAFKRHSNDTAEIKRMFVRPDCRGQRIGGQILGELELWAKKTGFVACLLETGYKQPEAIALYRREGYEVIPNYGQYSDVATSVCMKKFLIEKPTNQSSEMT